MLKDYKAYALFIYMLKDKYPEIQFAKIHFFTTSSNKSTAFGIFYFQNQMELHFREVVNFVKGKILDYSYEVRQYNQAIYYYDPQPHPEVAATFPHHKHVNPNIKNNRQPAPGISFDKPNLPFRSKRLAKIS